MLGNPVAPPPIAPLTPGGALKWPALITLSQAEACSVFRMQ